jgi:RNA polymerase sigma-70 factor (ECF subfamily)
MNTRSPSTETIWRDLSDDLRRFIRRRVADHELAEDLLQETFVRIHRHIDSLADGERLLAWVYRIARNVINDSYRLSAREKTRTIDFAKIGETRLVAETNDPLTRQPCTSCNWQEELVSQLPETYREAIRLAELEGLTQHEIAERLGLSLSGAKSRVQRARALLKQALEACCRFEFDRRGNLLDVEPKPGRPVCRDCDD